MEIAKSRILVVMLLVVYAFLVLVVSEIFTKSDTGSVKLNTPEGKNTHAVRHIIHAYHQIKVTDRIVSNNQEIPLFITHL